MDELKPCPFCGGEAVLKKVLIGVCPDDYEYYVKCDNIICSVYLATCNRPTAEEATEDWNRRAE